MISGKLEVAQVLLEAHADVKTYGGDGVPLLILSVQQCDSGLVRLLLDADADADTGSLVLASELGAVELVHMLLEAGADKDGTWECVGLTPLLAACRSGNLGVAGLLVQFGSDPNKASWAGSPLLAACLEGHVEIACCLVEAGAFLDEVCSHADSDFRLTPLVATASYGHVENSQLLLEARADVLKATDNGPEEPCQTPLLEACLGGHVAVVLALLAFGADRDLDKEYYHLRKDVSGFGVGRQTTPLVAAIEGGHTGVVSVLLQEGAKPDGGKESPLLGACGLGHLEIISALLEAAADANRMDAGAQRITPLIAACAMASMSSDRRQAMVHLLLQRMADTNQDATTTPLVLASLSGDVLIVRDLLEAGADIDAPASSSVLSLGEGRCYSPLTAACCRGHAEVVKLLLQEMADTNDAPSVETPLIGACLGGFVEIARMLLEAGADANVEASVREHSGLIMVSAQYTPLTAAYKNLGCALRSYAPHSANVQQVNPDLGPVSFNYRSPRLRYAFSVRRLRETPSTL